MRRPSCAVAATLTALVVPAAASASHVRVSPTVLRSDGRAHSIRVALAGPPPARRRAGGAPPPPRPDRPPPASREPHNRHRHRDRPAAARAAPPQALTG